jgi:hypothetical protein
VHVAGRNLIFTCAIVAGRNPIFISEVAEYIAYQRLVFRHLKGLLGGDKLVLVEPQGEIGTPQQRIFAIKIALDEALCLNNKTDLSEIASCASCALIQ